MDESKDTVHSRALSLCPPEVRVQEVQAELQEEGGRSKLLPHVIHLVVGCRGIICGIELVKLTGGGGCCQLAGAGGHCWCGT
jgi:hypothetical protein